MPYAPQGVKGTDDDDECHIHSYKMHLGPLFKQSKPKEWQTK